jgi:hypothetical protein
MLDEDMVGKQTTRKMSVQVIKDTIEWNDIPDTDLEARINVCETRSLFQCYSMLILLIELLQHVQIIFLQHFAPVTSPPLQVFQSSQKCYCAGQHHTTRQIEVHLLYTC